jgi:UDP-N-acetyl-D-galactosamine dehydrogenase
VKKKWKIAVIGIGYVGLPLILGLAKKYNVIGYDINNHRIETLKKKIDINKENIISKNKNLYFTNKIDQTNGCNIYIITVPTPVNNKNKPDITMLISATVAIAKVLKKKDIVIYESTVYPGLVEDICGKKISKISGLKLNKDFFLGYSPERINPGDKLRPIHKIDKLISASNKNTLKVLREIYTSFIKAKVIDVPSIKIAESAKIIENTQRDVNIALINEFSIIFDKLGIDTEKVLSAASTKWNFIKGFKPGLVGGHCIGVDPYYLANKAIKLGVDPKVILAGRKINDTMFKTIGQRILKINSQVRKSKPNILMFGITFKKNCSDIRNSQLIKLHSYLKERSSKLYVYDNLAYINEKIKKKNKIYLSKNLNFIKTIDIIIIGVNHDYTKSILKKILGKIHRKAFIFQIDRAIDTEKNIKIYNI